MRREKITWLVVLLLIVGSAFLVWMVAARPQWSMLVRPQPDLTLRVSSDYAREIKTVVDNYVTSRMNYGTSSDSEKLKKDWLELATKTQTALLKLKVPAKKTELHLGLVLELNDIKDALVANDLEKAQAAEIKLIKLFGQI